MSELPVLIEPISCTHCAQKQRDLEGYALLLDQAYRDIDQLRNQLQGLVFVLEVEFLRQHDIDQVA